MDTFYYVVKKIDGDYAVLYRTDTEDNEGIIVARALLPQDIDEGTNLKWECFQYFII